MQPSPESESSPLSRPWTAFLVAATGTFMATLDSGIVNVALPTIADTFHVGLPTTQWVVSVYLLTIVSFLPLTGNLGDRYGRKYIFAIGFLVFSVGSILCGAAHSMGMLLFARFVQAMGSAIFMANGPAVIMEAFPGRSRGRAFGIIGTIVGVGSLIGPTLGGFVLGALSWRWLFYLGVPIGLAGIVMALIYLENYHLGKQKKFDLGGSVSFAVGITALILVLTQGQKWGVTTWPTIMTACAAVGSAFVFYRVERHTTSPIIDFNLFRVRPYALGTLASLCGFTATFCDFILLPFYLHDVMHLPPTAIGAFLAIFPLGMAIMSPISGYLSERAHEVLLPTSGLVVFIAGLVSLALLTTTSPAWRVVLGQSLLGLGYGTFIAPNNNSVLRSVPLSHAGMAGSIIALARNIGMVIGVALATAVYEAARGIALNTGAIQEEAFMAGLRAAFFSAAAVALIAATASALRKPIFRK
ncbi:MFS transporter [Desulfovibrio inopinatus]|uniref:MFS transporter n=1 Tax=Desulfovibrio inopinatus TaxID=102109 RepID=UPI00041DD933|nr:MFS transporter [Desulfovibrio inopinatus]